MTIPWNECEKTYRASVFFLFFLAIVVFLVFVVISVVTLFLFLLVHSFSQFRFVLVKKKKENGLDRKKTEDRHRVVNKPFHRIFRQRADGGHRLYLGMSYDIHSKFPFHHHHHQTSRVLSAWNDRVVSDDDDDGVGPNHLNVFFFGFVRSTFCYLPLMYHSDLDDDDQTGFVVLYPWLNILDVVQYLLGRYHENRMSHQSGSQLHGHDDDDDDDLLRIFQVTGSFKVCVSH